MKKILSLVLLLVIFSTASAQAGDKEARAYVKDVSNRVIAIIANKSATQDAKQAKLIKLFDQTVDTQWIGHFVLGHYYRSATDAQKKKYDDVYHEFLIRSYVPRFKEYKGQTVQIGETKAQGKDEYLVKTNIISAGSEPPISVNYRVREENGIFHVVDIISEGVSLINTQRSEFGSVVSRQGMDYLIKQLKERLAAMKAGN